MGLRRAAVLSLAAAAPLVAPTAALGAASARSPIAVHIAVALRSRNPAALAAYVRAVSTPGSPEYRLYLTPAEFARRFGATAGQVAAVRGALSQRGLRSGALSAGGLSLRVSTTRVALTRAFAPLAERDRAVAAAAAVTALGARASAAVQTIVGLNGDWAPKPLLVRSATRTAASTPAARAPIARADTVSGGAQPCAAAQQDATAAGAYTENQIASAYGFPGLYRTGDQGAGITVAVYELEPDDPADIAAYQACYGTGARISYISVDGGAGTGAGTGEAALDIENLIGLAPDVNVLVYQGPNSGEGNPGSGPYDTLSEIVNQDRARVVSISWGQCEQMLGQADAAAEYTLFQQAAVQGQSVVAATGDNGAQDCYEPGSAPEDTLAAVDDPAAQPLVTGVGGTSLTSLGPPPIQTAWNDGGSLALDQAQTGASGGGASSFWPMPAAQADARPSLGVRDHEPPAAVCAGQIGACRLVPDVSADADPRDGYLIFWNGAGSVAGQQQGWQAIGGTSGAAPVWAALLALADASRGCATGSVGYANPALYRAAGADYAGLFDDVTSGDNDYTGTNGGLFAAGPGYDPVTGLGTPQAAGLASTLCRDAVRIGDPGGQLSARGAAVALRLHARAVTGAQVDYGAFGLPPGLRLDAATGAIAGRPSRPGRYEVLVSARDDEGATASARFSWAVGAAPRISRLTLTAQPSGPQLSFVVSAGRGSPPVSSITIAVPRNLVLRARRGVRMTDLGSVAMRLPFTERLRGPDTLTLALRSAAPVVSVTLGPPGLRYAPQIAQARSRRLGAADRVRLSIGVTDADAGRSELRARVKAPAAR